MTPSLSNDPRDRMGIYNHIDDVPESQRFERYEDQYDGRDVWATFLKDHLFDIYGAERSREKAKRAGRRWKQHVRARDRHHALVRPRDVESWCGALLERVTLDTAYNNYWVCLERFYHWLARHPDHPHRYDPVLMAATHYEHAGAIWATKIERGTES